MDGEDIMGIIGPNGTDRNGPYGFMSAVDKALVLLDGSLRDRHAFGMTAGI
jgi:hypothetical protein